MKRLVLAMALILATVRAHAEVAVQRWSDGRYRSFRIGSHVDDGRVLWWDQNGGPNRDDYLNLSGDVLGDMVPMAVTLPANMLQVDPTPLVVWSHNQRGGLDIVYSVWLRERGWTEPIEIGHVNELDDIGVRILKDPSHQVHVVWWSNDKVPTVSYARFDRGSWSAPVQVSPPNRDSRNPRFVLDGLDLYINYEDWTSKPVHTESFLKQHLDP